MMLSRMLQLIKFVHLPNLHIVMRDRHWCQKMKVSAKFSDVCPLIKHILLFPVNCETTVFLGTLSVTVLSITKDIFVYHAITIRCKRRVKNCKFQFDISDS